MTPSLNIMNVALRVLGALNAKKAPAPADVEALRHYLGRPGPSDLDELACDVIQKARFERAKSQEAIKTRGGPS